MEADRLRNLLKLTKKLESPNCRHYPIETRPECTFAAVLEERLRFIAIDLSETKSRMNVLIWTVIGAIIISIALEFTK